MSVTENLSVILNKVSGAYGSADPSLRAIKHPRLVAVSKTKPVEMIVEAYEAGHRDFGENYVQELDEKSHNENILSSCPEIRWHFIGSCQTNKVNKLMGCPNLCMVETVASAKLATKMNSQVKDGSPVGVLVQVNTSGEDNKSGVDMESTLGLVKHIKESCPRLKFCGLMTIGDLGNSVAASTEGDNPDFLKLRQVRKKISEDLKLDESDLELSMGMSKDFEDAIRLGSTNVRVGSSIFGGRSYPPKPVSTSDNVTDKLEKIEIK